VSVHQTSHGLLREALRGDLLAGLGSGGDDGGLGGTEYRARAALYALLGDHPIDRRGRCRCCRGRRALLGRRCRVCRVLAAVRFSVHQPVPVVLEQLASDAQPAATPVDPRARDGRPTPRRGRGGLPKPPASPCTIGRVRAADHGQTVPGERRMRVIAGVSGAAAVAVAPPLTAPQAPVVALPHPPAAHRARRPGPNHGGAGNAPEPLALPWLIHPTTTR